MAQTPTPFSMSMVPVVGPQFCQPFFVTLIIKKKFSFSGGDFSISGANNGILMKVGGAEVVEGFVSFDSHRVLYDAAGVPIISMRRQVMSTSDRWNIYQGESNDQRALLFTLKKPSIFEHRTVHVFLASNPSEQTCDFKIKKDWFERSYTIYLGNSETVVAVINSHFELSNMLLGTDGTFHATVYPNVDYAFIVAIFVILDDIYHRQR